MAYKFIAIIACAAVASAALLPVKRLEQAEEYDSHPSYSFSYEVQDSDTGDFKSQSETRDGDAVQGQYSLQDADGYQRIVEYRVNGESGFNAVVRREPLNSADAVVGRAQAPAAEPAPAPIEATAPASTAAPKAAPPKLAAAPLSPPALLKPFKLQAAYVQPAAYYRTAYAAPTTVLHHAPAHTVIHSAPSLHLAPAATHFLHAAPSTTLLKSHPTVITHHAPAVVRTSFASPHYQYVY